MKFGLKSFAFVLAFVVAVSMVATSFGTEFFVSSAQAETKIVKVKKKKNIFQVIFGNRKKTTKKTTKKTVKRKRTTKAKTAVAAVEKVENAQTVLVMGDFIASGLADGLKVAYAKNPNVAIVKKTRGSSTIARPDNYDWMSQTAVVVEEVKPSLIVFNIGSSDRQDMKVDGTWLGFDSEEWWAEYRKRVDSLAQVLRSQNVPVLWVGVPSFKYTKMTRDILAFNGIYRDAIEKAGGTFVDIWEGFVDENGKFVYTGSDINGQQVRLRSSDGINLTKAGKRKLAFYVEKPASRFLSIGNSVLANLYRDAPASAFANRPVQDPRLLTKTRVYSFTDPELDGGDYLLGGNSQARVFKEKSPLDNLIQTGQTPVIQTGRVDDFTWKASVGVKKPAVEDVKAEDKSASIQPAALINPITATN
ncbi:MAG: DUF459 domain-containing protein [Lentilitoribacter sp.]